MTEAPKKPGLYSDKQGDVWLKTKNKFVLLTNGKKRAGREVRMYAAEQVSYYAPYTYIKGDYHV